jgi:hypothetical protein
MGPTTTSPQPARRGFATLSLALGTLAVAGVILAGCASAGGGASFKRGQEAARREMWDTAVLSYAKAVAENPENSRYRVALERSKMSASAVHFDRGKKYLVNNQLELAVKELQEACILAPSNQYAVNELNRASA